MGGVPPLGYRAQDSKLLVIESEAKIVCAIFRRYAELGSVRLLKDELEARGIKSKSWTTASGRRVGGKPFSRGALYLMLQNRLYRGEIVHKGQSHRGEHTPIISPSHARSRRSPHGGTDSSPTLRWRRESGANPSLKIEFPC